MSTTSTASKKYVEMQQQSQAQLSSEQQPTSSQISPSQQQQQMRVPCPNFEEPFDLSLLGAEMDIDLKTSKSLSGKQYILAIPITQFFRNVRNMYALVNILNGQSIISLRLIEYFVVNYVLENNTFFDINRYNKCPEYLISNLREKVYEIPASALDAGIPASLSATVTDKHNPISLLHQGQYTQQYNLAASITAQQIAYKKARDEIIADIQSKKAAGGNTNVTGATNGRARTSAPKPAKKQPITLETFFSQRAITDYTAAQKLQQQQQQPSTNSPVTAQQPKNFDNYIIVHDNYKCQLKEYNKKNFDPFCRWNRIRMYYDKNKFFYTTIAQLNFFKWAIEKHILDYVIENLETIEKSMNEYEKSVKAEKQLRKARQLLEKASVAGTATANPNSEAAASAATTVANGIEGPTRELARENEKVEPGSEDANETLEGPDNYDEITNETMTKNNELLPISLLSNTRKTVKKNIVLGNPENKSLVNIRRKKEFTKTNRSILVFSAYKVVKFD